MCLEESAAIDSKRGRPRRLHLDHCSGSRLSLGHHAFLSENFRKNVESDLQGRLNLEVVILLPNALILPMHLTIIFGVGMGSNRLAVLLFSTLKTGADYLMHIVEHMMLQKKIPKE